MKPLAILALLAAVASPLLAQFPQPPAKPNIIVVLCDDYGYNDIGPNTYPSPADYYPNSGPPPNFPQSDPDIPAPNHARTLTPRLDLMADQGIRLTSFYSCARNCTPARASLMTGCYATRVGMPDVINPTSNRGLNTTEITLPEILKTRGYATGMVGKWHLGYAPLQTRRAQFLPTRQGFDEYLGLPYSNDMFQEPLYLIEDENPVELMGTSWADTGANQHKLIWRYTERALDFIDRNQAGPFFLYIAQSMPHVPVHPSKTTFPNADGTTWPKFEGASGVSWYYDIVMEIDHSMGRIFDKLQALGIDDNTLVIFTSDNGPWLSKSGVDLLDTAVGCAYPLRDSKSTTFEGGPRVPFLARWPGQIPAGQVSDEVGGLIDLVPTLSKLAGTAPPADRTIDGRDLWPVLTAQPDATTPHPELYYYSSSTMHAVRRGPWKFRRVSGTSLLYHLDNDIQERSNLLTTEPALAADLESTLDAFDAELQANKRPQGTYSDQEIVLDTTRLTLPEGGTTSFQVKLAQAPAGPLEVRTAPLFGDDSIAVQTGAVLSFDPGTWDTWQTVTLAAAEDPDTLSNGTIIRCSSPSFQPVREVFALATDNDTTPGIEISLLWPTIPHARLSTTADLLHAEGLAAINSIPNPPGTTFSWTATAGPPGPVFTTPTAPSTTISFPQNGDYTIRLEVAYPGAGTAATEFELTVGATPLTLPAPTLSYAAAADADGNAIWEELGGNPAYNWTLATGTSALTRSTTDPAPALPGLDASYLFTGGPIPAGARSLHYDAFSTANATIELWCKPDDLATPGAQVLWETGGDIGASLTRDGATLSFAVDDGGSNAATGAIASATLSAASGHDGFIHLVAVIDLAGDTLHLYLNGSEVNTAAIPAVTDWCGSSHTGLGTIADSNGAESTNLGHLGGNDLLGPGPFSTFAGQIAALRLYDRTLTPAEVGALFTAASVGGTAPQTAAGPDQAIAFTATATLNGSVLDDGRPGSPLTLSWTRVSGPGTALFSNPSSPSTTATFNLPGLYVLSLAADDSQVRTCDLLEVTVAPLTYLEWASDTAFPPGMDGPGDNPDHDLWVNLWEWTLGLNPLVPESGTGALHFQPTPLPDGTRMTIQFDKPRDRQPTIGLQQSTDLLLWDEVLPVPAVVEPTSAATEHWTLTYDAPDTTPRLFLRVRVSE